MRLTLEELEGRETPAVVPDWVRGVPVVRPFEAAPMARLSPTPPPPIVSTRPVPIQGGPPKILVEPKFGPPTAYQKRPADTVDAWAVKLSPLFSVIKK